MKLSSFHVTKFRNIVDSGPIKVDPAVTCLVGKNEAGKSGLLEALYLLHPAYEEAFNVEDQYPRWLASRDRKEGSLESHKPISATFVLEASDYEAVSAILGEGVLTGEAATVARTYGGNRTWNFTWSEQTAIKNLLAKFDQSVTSHFSGVGSLDKLRNKLEELSANRGEESAINVGPLGSAVKESGLDKVGIGQRIVQLLETRLPHFFRFTEYSTLPGRIDFRKLAASEEEGPATTDLQTARALLELAGTDMQQLANEDYELRRAEVEAVQIELTNQVFEYWKQNPDLEVVIDVDKETVGTPQGHTAVARFLDIRLRDRRTGYSNNFKQRSSGFQWFFSFLAAFSEFEGRESPVVLLDEPALNLHGRAQADFLRFINQRLSPKSQVIYTTHSPFMVEADKLERIRIIEDHGPPNGAVCNDEVLASDPDSLFPLQAALGYDIAQNLFVGPNNLVVEGTSDWIYLTIMSAECAKAGRESLDDRWRTLPAGGASNIPTFVSLIGRHLDITVLADTNARGMQRINKMIDRKILADHRLILANVATGSSHADIEDAFSEGDYLMLYNRAFGTSIKPEDLAPGDRIVKRIEDYIGCSFDHGQVAEMLLREHHQIAFSDLSLERFEKLIKEINATIDRT